MGLTDLASPRLGRLPHNTRRFDAVGLTFKPRTWASEAGGSSGNSRPARDTQEDLPENKAKRKQGGWLLSNYTWG